METYLDLLAEREALMIKLDAARMQARSAALSEVKRIVEEFELTTQEVFGRAGVLRRRGKLKPKYRDPKTGATWNGAAARLRGSPERIAPRSSLDARAPSCGAGRQRLPTPRLRRACCAPIARLSRVRYARSASGAHIARASHVGFFSSRSARLDRSTDHRAIDDPAAARPRARRGRAAMRPSERRVALERKLRAPLRAAAALDGFALHARLHAALRAVARGFVDGPLVRAGPRQQNAA